MLNSMEPSDSIYAKIQLRRAEVETMLETEFNLKEYGETLKKEGKEEGLKEGKGIGKHEQAVETCKRMLELGLPLDIIQKSTELGKEEIQKIQKTLQDK